MASRRAAATAAAAKAAEAPASDLKSVRHQLRQLERDIRVHTRDLEQNAGKLSEAIEEQRKLTATQAMGDERTNLAATTVVAELAKIGKKQAKALVGAAGLPNTQALAAAFKGLYPRAHNGFDWVKFGLDMSVYFSELPPVRVLFGPTDVEPKQKAVKAAAKQPKRVLDRFDGPPETAETIEAGEETGGGEGKNAGRAAELLEALLKLQEAGRNVSRVECVDGKTRRAMHMLKTLVDPWSYSQTVRVEFPNIHVTVKEATAARVAQVENFFYFSVLVKSPPMAAVFLGQDGEPYIKVYPWRSPDDPECATRGMINYGSDDEADDDAATAPSAASSSRARKPPAGTPGSAKVDFKSKQFAVQVDHSAWLKICAEYKLTKPVTPHRKSSDSSAPADYHFVADAAPAKTKPAAPAASGRSRPARASAGTKRRAAEMEDDEDAE